MGINNKVSPASYVPTVTGGMVFQDGAHVKSGPGFLQHLRGPISKAVLLAATVASVAGGIGAKLSGENSVHIPNEGTRYSVTHNKETGGTLYVKDQAGKPYGHVEIEVGKDGKITDICVSTVQSKFGGLVKEQTQRECGSEVLNEYFALGAYTKGEQRLSVLDGLLQNEAEIREMVENLPALEKEMSQKYEAEGGVMQAYYSAHNSLNGLNKTAHEARQTGERAARDGLLQPLTPEESRGLSKDEMLQKMYPDYADAVQAVQQQKEQVSSIAKDYARVQDSYKAQDTAARFGEIRSEAETLRQEKAQAQALRVDPHARVAEVQARVNNKPSTPSLGM